MQVFFYFILLVLLKQEVSGFKVFLSRALPSEVSV